MINHGYHGLAITYNVHIFFLWRYNTPLLYHLNVVNLIPVLPYWILPNHIHTNTHTSTRTHGTQIHTHTYHTSTHTHPSRYACRVALWSRTQRVVPKFFTQICREEGVRGLYRVSGTLLFGRRYSVLIMALSLSPPHPPPSPPSSPPPSFLSSLPPPLPQGVGPTAQRAAVIVRMLASSYDFFKKLISFWTLVS